MSSGRKRPERLDSVLRGFLEDSGLSRRIDQAGVIPEWPRLVGARIAAVTEPRLVTPDGVLFVAVRTHAWMTELSMLEPQLLTALNEAPERPAGRPPVRRIRWQLMR